MKNKYFQLIALYLSIMIPTIITAKEFRIISLDNFENLEKIRFQDFSTHRDIVIEKYHPNWSYTVPPDNLIHFYGIDKETKASSLKPILRISFSDQKSDTLVLLQKGDDNTTINHKFIENNEDSFPKLSSMILNLTDTKIIAKIGSEIVKIEAKSQKLILLPKNERGSFSEEAVFAAQREDNSINYFYSTFWRVPGGYKTLCIVNFNPDSNSYYLKEILL